MYDRHLDTFIQTADCGSFLKASEIMFISANAITKQINLLEERLTFQDLHGETLWLAQRGLSPCQDRVRDELEQHHPEIAIKSAPYLDTDSFNRLASSRELMLSAQCWGGVHPLLATIPLDCPYTIPYGLIYAKDPPKEVMQFIMAVGQVNEIE